MYCIEGYFAIMHIQIYDYNIKSDLIKRALRREFVYSVNVYTIYTAY